MIIKSKVGVFIVGSDPSFDFEAVKELAKLKITYDFIGGTGYGATAAAFLASGQGDVLGKNAQAIAEDDNTHGSSQGWRTVFGFGKVRMSPNMSDLLDVTALRSSPKPVIVPVLNNDENSCQAVDLRGISSNELLFDILRASQTLPDAKADYTQRTNFDGSLLDIFGPLSAMLRAGAERIILITSAIPITSKEPVLTQFLRIAQNANLIQALCLCQAYYPTLQVHLVAPSNPYIDAGAKWSKEHKDFTSKILAPEIVKLANFDVNPPDPSLTGWAAVIALQDIAARSVRSTGIQILMNGESKDVRKSAITKFFRR